MELSVSVVSYLIIIIGLLILIHMGITYGIYRQLRNRRGPQGPPGPEGDK